MPRHHFSPQLHQSAAPFSHYVEHGNIGYTAGIIGQRRDTGELVSDDVSQQCDTMLTNLHTPTFTAEATSVASVLPCRRGFDTKLRPGYVLVLAGSHAR